MTPTPPTVQLKLAFSRSVHASEAKKIYEALSNTSSDIGLEFGTPKAVGRGPLLLEARVKATWFNTHDWPAALLQKTLNSTLMDAKLPTIKSIRHDIGVQPATS